VRSPAIASAGAALDPILVARAIDKRLDNTRQHVGKGFRIAPDTTDLFKRAMERARSRGRKTIEATDIFDVLSNYDSLLVEVLLNLGATPEAVVEHVRTNVNEREQHEEQYRKKFELPPYLKHFGVSLNRLARADKIPPTIGREKEIQQIIEILCHRERANSPMLVGEPGVGKTAVIEGLARMIELEPHKVPARLRNSHVVQLQMGGIVAGSNSTIGAPADANGNAEFSGGREADDRSFQGRIFKNTKKRIVGEYDDHRGRSGRINAASEEWGRS